MDGTSSPGFRFHYTRSWARYLYTFRGIGESLCKGIMLTPSRILPIPGSVISVVRGRAMRRRFWKRKVIEDRKFRHRALNMITYVKLESKHI